MRTLPATTAALARALLLLAAAAGPGAPFDRARSAAQDAGLQGKALTRGRSHEPPVTPLAHADCNARPETVQFVAPRLSGQVQSALADTQQLTGQRPRLIAGPIVGAVSAGAASVWLKADRPARWRLLLSEPEHRGARMFEGKLSAPNDFIHTQHLAGLRPSTHYALRVELTPLAHDAALPALFDASFRTLPPAGAAGRVRIAFGADISHVAEQPIFEQLAGVEPDAVLLLGDQVYTDALAPDYPSFSRKYTQSWRIPALRNLLRRYPSFMIWDDHEIADDYFAGSSERYAPARLAYELYVQPHNPAPLRAGKLYYTFQVGDIDFFVLDVRSERADPRAPEGPQKSMLGPQQKADLFQWLTCSRAKFKVIVSPVALSDHVHGNDAWKAYPSERDQLFELIERERVNGVLVLSGDQHWSAVFLHDRPHLRVYELMATPLSKERKPAPTEPWPEILARDDDQFVFGVVDFDTLARPNTVTFTLCAAGKPCRVGAEPAPTTGLNLRGTEENVPFTLQLTSDEMGVR